MGINPVEGEGHAFPQGEQPQAAVCRSAERHHGGFPVGTDLHAAGETSGIKSCDRLDINVSSLVFSCFDCIEPGAGRQWGKEKQMLFGAKTLEWSW